MTEESEKVGLKHNVQKPRIMASGPITSWQTDGETMETVRDFIFLGSKITADGECSHKIKTLAPWKESYDQARRHIKKQTHYFSNKGLSSQSYGFSSSHVQCESWTIKKAEHKRIGAFEIWCWRRLLSPLDRKEIKQVNSKGNQPWIFIGRTDAEASVLWPPYVKNWLIGKDPDAGKDWRQEEKGTTESETVGSHHQLSEFEANSWRYWRTRKPVML